MSKKLFLLLGIFLLFSVMFFKPVFSYTPPPNGTTMVVYTWSTETAHGCRIGVNSSITFRCYPNTVCDCSSEDESCTFYSHELNWHFCYGSDLQWYPDDLALWDWIVPNKYNVSIIPWIIGIGEGYDIPNPDYDPTWVTLNFKLYNSSSRTECQAEDSTNTCFDCNSDPYGSFIYGLGYTYCSRSYDYTMMPSDTAYTLIGNRSDWFNACSQLCSVGYDPEAGFGLLHAYVTPHEEPAPPPSINITPAWGSDADVVDILAELLVGLKSFFGYTASPIFLFLFIFAIVFIILMIFGLVVAVAKRASKSF